MTKVFLESRNFCEKILGGDTLCRGRGVTPWVGAGGTTCASAKDLLAGQLSKARLTIRLGQGSPITLDLNHYPCCQHPDRRNVITSLSPLPDFVHPLTYASGHIRSRLLTY